MSPQVLLLQARDPEDQARLQELRAFAGKLQRLETRIVPYDLLQGPPTLAHIRAHDALMVGGSGDYYVSKGNLPGFDGLLDVLREVVDVGHPTFASCFGFQCMVLALGGEIVHDAENTELGTFDLDLTDEGSSDPLFGALPPTFQAQLGHKDRAARMPESVDNLASSRLCAFQALRVPGRPIWASQFHPELDREENLGRYLHYVEAYAAALSQAQLDEAVASFRETSLEVLDLLPRFMSLVFE